MRSAYNPEAAISSMGTHAGIFKNEVDKLIAVFIAAGLQELLVVYCFYALFRNKK